MRATLILFLLFLVMKGMAQNEVNSRLTMAQKVIVDIPYIDKGDTYHQLDLYLPALVENAPVLVFVHGGDRGDKRYETLGTAFARKGIVVAVPNYRLVPEHSHPAQTDDIAAAVAWVRKHINEVGGNPNAIVLSGHSSGAVLVAMVGLDKTYLSKHGMQPTDLAGYVPISGLYDLAGTDQWLLDWFGKEETQRKAISPIAHTTSPTAPFLLMAGESDFKEAIDSAEKLTQLLKSTSNKADFRKISRRNHVGIVREMVMNDDPAFREVLGFIRQHTAATQSGTDAVKRQFGFEVVNRTLQKSTERGKDIIRFSEAEGSGVAWLTNKTFSEGTIEFDARGRDVPQKSFIGVAFHGVDNKTYEAVYFRPFNFQATDPIRKIHAVQYVFEPAFPWEVLRAKRNGEFEKAILPATIQATDWFHAKVEVRKGRIRVFVDGSPVPCLDVPTLNLSGQSGKVGLWVGNNSNGDFANLTISNTTP